MANNLGIPERTLAAVADSTNSINVIGGAQGRLSAYQPLVVRITDHQDNVGAEADDPYRMAIFESKAHGQPWIKKANVLERVISKQGTGATATATVTTGAVTAIDVTAGGTGYYTPATEVVISGDGTGATAEAVVENGVVTGFTITAGGTGYSSATVAINNVAVPVNVSEIYPDFDYSTFE